jgi:hypothetical protein
MGGGGFPGDHLGVGTIAGTSNQWSFFEAKNQTPST